MASCFLASHRLKQEQDRNRETVLLADISGILQAFLVDKLSGTGQQLLKELFARQLHEMTQCKSSGGNLPPSSNGK